MTHHQIKPAPPGGPSSHEEENTAIIAVTLTLEQRTALMDAISNYAGNLIDDDYASAHQAYDAILDLLYPGTAPISQP